MIYLLLFIVFSGLCWIVVSSARDSKASIDYFENESIGAETADIDVDSDVDDDTFETYPQRFPHTMLIGGAGLGKTTLANIVRNECELVYGHEINVFAMTPENLRSQKQLNALMLGIQSNDIIFIDEIHMLPSNIANQLLVVLQENKFYLNGQQDTQLGGGVSLSFGDDIAETITLPRFTFIGGTTDVGLLPRPLVERFNIIQLDPYTNSELAQITINYTRRQRHPERLDEVVGQKEAVAEIRMELDALAACVTNSEIGFDDDAADAISRISFNTPRTALKYTNKCYSLAKAAGEWVVTTDTVTRFIEQSGIDENGLTPFHQKIVAALIQHGKPMGNNAIAQRCGMSAADVEMYFADLSRVGICERDARSWKKISDRGLALYGALAAY